jgi:hypothetical protein
MTHRPLITSLLAGTVLAGSLAGGATALAGEKGHFRGLAVLNNTKFNEVKAPEGHPYKAAWSGEQEGLVFNDERKPFLDKAHYVVQYVGDAGTVSGYCLKTFTMKDGDQLFARCDWRGQESGSAGTVTILGGTGKYSGIKGTGTFKFTNVSPVVNWDILEIDYEIP